jgi:hypothetical protein
VGVGYFVGVKEATMSKGKADKVDFSDVMEGDKLTIKWDVKITKIEDLDEYLNPTGARKAFKVFFDINSGPFKGRPGMSILFADDKVSMHARPTWQKKLWNHLFGKVKRK